MLHEPKRFKRLPLSAGFRSRDFSLVTFCLIRMWEVSWLMRLMISFQLCVYWSALIFHFQWNSVLSRDEVLISRERNYNGSSRVEIECQCLSLFFIMFFFLGRLQSSISRSSEWNRLKHGTAFWVVQSDENKRLASICVILAYNLNVSPNQFVIFCDVIF